MSDKKINKEELQKKLEEEFEKASNKTPDVLSEFKETLRQVETFGLSDVDRAAVAQDTGHWPPQIQLLVSAYIKNLRFKNAVMYKTLEVLSSKMINASDVSLFASSALEQVSLRSWRNIPQEKDEE